MTKCAELEVICRHNKDSSNGKIRPLANLKTYLHRFVINHVRAFFSLNSVTKKHSYHVAKLAYNLARYINLPNDKITDILLGSLLHDVGKCKVPAEVLNNAGSLTYAEWESIKQHPIHGYNVIRKSNLKDNLAIIVLHHHERYDGTGYPFGLKGNTIPLASRVISLADSYDAMTSIRSYKSKKTKNDALVEIEKCSGKQFDPELASAFIKMLSKRKYQS